MRSKSNRAITAKVLLASLFFITAVLATKPAVAATIYLDGLVHTISTDLVDEVIINDSGGGNPTTVNYVSGGKSQGLTVWDNSFANLSDDATITSGGFSTNNNATITISDDVVINNQVTAQDNSTVNWSGGSFFALGTFDMLDTSMTTITDGEFHAPLRAFESASISISGGTFNDYVYGIGGVPATKPKIDISGGTFLGEILAQGGSQIDIFGGTLTSIRAAQSSSVIRLFGSNFLATCDKSLGGVGGVSCQTGEIVLLGFGTISSQFGGTITGTLADGTPLNIEAGNVLTDFIILAPIPIPAAFWLFASALGFLGWMRRKAS